MGTEFGCFPTAALLLTVFALGSWLLFKRWRESSAWRSRAINVTLLALSLGVAFVAAEGYFHFFVDITDSAMNTLTSQRWSKRRYPQPLGTFRGRSLLDRGRPGSSGVSIAVVGDSITFGQGIEREEELYSSILERGLRARGIAAAVYNISQFSWDTAEELAEFVKASEKGGKFDIVVLGYCLNDISPFVAGSHDFLKARSLLTTPPRTLAPLVRRSFVASYLYNRYVMLTQPSLKATERSIVEAYRQPEIFAQHARKLNGFRGRAWWYGTRLIVLTFPHCTVPWERYPVRDIHRKLDEFWKEQGVQHIDLLPVFERYPVGDFQASALDTHPNELAHRLAGEQLVEKIASLLAPQTEEAPTGPNR